MSVTRRKFLAACVGAGAIAVLGTYRQATPVIRERWYLFGTLLDVTIAGVEATAAKPVLKKLAASLQKMNDDWHPWKAGVMGDINHAISMGQSILVDSHMAKMVRDSSQLYAQSEGRFNPAIGHIVSQWGFHGGKRNDWGLPNFFSIRQILDSNPSPQDLSINNSKLYSHNHDVKIDFGGYAKGYAINLGMHLLREHGIDNAIINAGGDLQVMGSEGTRPWRIAIRHPQRQGHVAWLQTSGSEGVYTSGNYERYRESEGVRYSHILNPLTGMPVNEIASATVIHHDGARADAAATALVIAGTKHWREVANNMGIDQAMVIDAHGRIHATRSMSARIIVA